MRIYSTGYGDWKFSPKAIGQRAATATERLARVEAQGLYTKGVDLLVVTGTSGIWLAPAMLDAGHCVILLRKPREDSHGSLIEGADYVTNSRPRAVLLDDFVSSGDTVRRTAEAIGDKLQVPLVAVVVHDPIMYDRKIKIQAMGFEQTIGCFGRGAE